MGLLIAAATKRVNSKEIAAPTLTFARRQFLGFAQNLARVGIAYLILMGLFSAAATKRVNSKEIAAPTLTFARLIKMIIGRKNALASATLCAEGTSKWDR